MHIGIIGGGFTGSLLAVNLLRQAKPGTVVTIVESADTMGLGAAYGTDDPEHLLNVRADNMGAFPDDPRHFHAWLMGRYGADAPPASSFVSRMRYGEYVADIFREAVAAHASSARLLVATGLATELHVGSRPTVRLSDGRQFAFDRIALCIGNMSPAEAPGLSAEARRSGRYIHDPWRARDLRAIPSDAEVLIVGSGLTMADVVQTLSGQGHKGLITVVSRHGLVPLRHESPRAHRMSQPKGGLLAMVRAVRAEVKTARAIGKDWRDVVDALRPWISDLWQGLSAADHRKFLRHLRPYWDVHRHRLAPATADALAILQGAGLLKVAAGRIESIDWRRGGFEVVMRPRGASQTVRLTPSWIVNCTGPQSDYAKVGNPLVRHALDVGAIRPDPLRQGLDVTGEGAVIDARGQRSSNIFAVGSPTRGVFWEITSVPDIRRECHRMASVLLRDQ